MLTEEQCMAIAYGWHIDNSVTLRMPTDKISASWDTIDPLVLFVFILFLRPVLLGYLFTPTGLAKLLYRHRTRCAVSQDERIRDSVNWYKIAPHTFLLFVFDLVCYWRWWDELRERLCIRGWRGQAVHLRWWWWARNWCRSLLNLFALRRRGSYPGCVVIVLVVVGSCLLTSYWRRQSTMFDMPGVGLEL